MKPNFEKFFSLSVVLLFCGLLVSCGKKNIGLCLSGGGAKGAYEAGVWKALCETGLDKRINAISGTSVGGLNAALFSSMGPEEAEEVWREDVDFDTILTTDFGKVEKVAEKMVGTVENIYDTYQEKAENNIEEDEKYSPFLDTLTDFFVSLGKGTGEFLIDLLNQDVKSYGFYSRQGLQDLVAKKVDLSKIQNSERDIFVSVLNKKHVLSNDEHGSNVEVIKLNNQPEEKIVPYLLATSAIPGVFDSVTLDDGEYIDGGYERAGGNNTNIDPLVENEKTEIIFAVFLRSLDEMQPSAQAQKEMKEVLKKRSENKIKVAEDYLKYSWKKGVTKVGSIFTKALNGIGLLDDEDVIEDTGEYDEYLENLHFDDFSEQITEIAEKYKDERFELEKIKEDAKGKQLVLFIPSQDLGGLTDGTLNFDKDQLNALVDLGYSDAMNVLRENKFIK